jgi:hypothetical protein
MNWAEYNSRIFYVLTFPELIQYRICRISLHTITQISCVRAVLRVSILFFNLTNQRMWCCRSCYPGAKYLVLYCIPGMLVAAAGQLCLQLAQGMDKLARKKTHVDVVANHCIENSLAVFEDLKNQIRTFCICAVGL